MLKLICSTIWERKWPVLIYCGSSLLLLLIYVAIFPSMQAQTQQLIQILQSMPKAILSAFGSANITNFTLENLLVSKYFSLVWPLLAAILGISMAGNDVAYEVEKGTIEFLLAQPISRTKIYFARFLAEIFALAIFSALSTISVIPMAIAFHINYVAINYFKLFLMAILFAWTIYALSLFFSCLFSNKGRVYGVMGTIIIAMYVASLVATLKDSLDKLKYLSFFYYFTSNILVDGKFNWLAIILFSIIIIIFLVLGLVVFQKRDIAV